MKKPSFKSLKSKLDALHSQWIRRKDATSQGFAVCVSCGIVKIWKELQCGHYVSRNYLAGRWLDKNTAVQCYACNVAKKGNYPEYAVFLKRKYGPEIFDELTALKRQVTKLTAADLEELVEQYKTKLAALEAQGK